MRTAREVIVAIARTRCYCPSGNHACEPDPRDGPYVSDEAVEIVRAYGADVIRAVYEQAGAVLTELESNAGPTRTVDPTAEKIKRLEAAVRWGAARLSVWDARTLLDMATLKEPI